MVLDWSNGELAAGLQCYCAKEFFEAHEHWECVWLKCEGPEKTFLQSLIQITAAFHHVQRGNLVGAARLLRGALEKLERFPGVYGGMDVEAVRAGVKEWIGALEQGNAAPPLAFPRIG